MRVCRNLPKRGTSCTMYFNTSFNIPKDNPVLNTIYKEYCEYNGHYLVGNDGTVHNRSKQLKTYQNNSGYVCIKLSNGGVKKHKLIHRMVAETFIANPDSKPEVNHIDGDKLNNNVCNLEWVTSSENKRHAFDTGLKVYNIPSKGKKLGTSSKYHNVGWDSARNKWKAHVRHENKNHFPKRFNSEEEAALHVNWILDQLGLTDRPRNNINS